MQYLAFEPGIEVDGMSLLAIVNGFGPWTSIALKFMAEAKMAHVERGQLVYNPKAWYPQGPWLTCLKRIANEVGSTTLTQIGRLIPEHAPWPPHIKNIDQAIQALDVAYHMNHRKNGTPMFDAASGKMLEGIGNYGYEQIGLGKIVSVCHNPYPCELDRGILEGASRRFEKTARVEHDSKAPCRKNGAHSCTYLISY